jgi:hypothetical protein
MKVKFKFFSKDDFAPFSTPTPLLVVDRVEARSIAEMSANMQAMGAQRVTAEQMDGPWRNEWDRETGWQKPS